MADAKRFPVVQIYISQPAFEFLKRTWGTPEAKDSCLVTEPTGIYTVPFEPAVPRCNTCGYSGTTNGVRECHESKPPRLIRQDGEGYCDEHTEARR